MLEFAFQEVSPYPKVMLYKRKLEINFDHSDLIVGVASLSKLVRVKIRQALKERVLSIYETADMVELVTFVHQFDPKVLILGFRFFSQDTFPGELLEMPDGKRPRIILTGSQQELDQAIDAKGVDALLCQPFLADMLLLKINSVLDPNRSWKGENDVMLHMMRKYQRFQVENVNIVFQKPVQERTVVTDMSYQGLKAETREITREHVGETFQMQIACEGAYILIHGRVQWVRENHVGIMFTRPKPAEFSDFFLRIIAKAVDMD
ncbi:MAG: hypothetical protein QNK37_23115 [Acidobacteriota bacterium]|nr:hypothetical protein [Acidobacteriota bacterium]